MQKYLYYTIIILFIINIVFGYIIFNGRTDQRRSAGLIKQLRSEISATNRTVDQLTKSGEDKQRTINDLTAGQRQSEKRISELTKVSQQRQDIINQLTAGTGSDSKDLQRVQQIIKSLPATK